MVLPFHRERLRERNAIDREQDVARFEAESPAERFVLALGLSQLARSLGRSAESGWVREAPESLEEKSRRYVAPLMAAGSS